MLKANWHHGPVGLPANLQIKRGSGGEGYEADNNELMTNSELLQAVTSREDETIEIQNQHQHDFNERRKSSINNRQVKYKASPRPTFQKLEKNDL